MATDETGCPREWDIKSGKNIKWVAELGSQSYGNVVVSNGKLFVGTNNELERNPKHKGDRGVIMCFEEATGKFLWQSAHAKLPTGRVNDWPEQGICSTPYIENDRLYYISNRCTVICADTEGFRDGENDGPYKREKDTSEIGLDIIWELDMMDELAVFPHNLATCSPLVGGDLLYVNTSNGVDEAHVNIPSPRAPSFLAIDKKTGDVAWEDNSPRRNILHGQWSNPAYAVLNGKAQVLFAGGDGWLYSFEAKSGELVWKFDCNPKDSVWELGGRGTRNNVIATPVVHENRVYISVGQDPEHGEGPGHLWCIDGTKTGDISGAKAGEKGCIWHFEKDSKGEPYGRTMCTVAITPDGLLFATDLSGFIYCLDAKTGKFNWKDDLLAAVWGSPYYVDGMIIQCDEDGDVVIYEASKTRKKIFETNTGGTTYSTPVFVNGTLYIMTKSKLYAIAKK